MLRRLTPQRQVIQDVLVPAPLGGVNTVSSSLSVPRTDCIYVYNVIAGEYGLCSQLGYGEWCTNLSNTLNNTVRSVLPFTGSAKNGSKDIFFLHRHNRCHSAMNHYWREFNVEHYGAVGDGVTDDTTAIQAAIQAQQAAGGMGFFPPAIAYRVSTSFTATLRRDLAIDFNGQPLNFYGTRITLSGTLVASGRTLAAPEARYATQMTLNSGTSVQAGDLLYITTSITPSSYWSDVKKELVQIRRPADPRSVPRWGWC